MIFMRSRALFPVLGEGGFQHFIGGRPHHGSDLCPNCKKDLTRFFQLSTDDPKLGLAVEKHVPIELVFCWQCELAQGEFSYKLETNGCISILNATVGPVSTSFPYPAYPRFFPERKIDLLEREELERIGGNHTIKGRPGRPKTGACVTQIGGKLRLFNRYKKRCPACNRRMLAFATVGDESFSERGFIGYQYAQVIFFHCLRCMVFTAVQECD